MPQKYTAHIKTISNKVSNAKGNASSEQSPVLDNALFKSLNKVKGLLLMVQEAPFILKRRFLNIEGRPLMLRPLPLKLTVQLLITQLSFLTQNTTFLNKYSVRSLPSPFRSPFAPMQLRVRGLPFNAALALLKKNTIRVGGYGSRSSRNPSVQIGTLPFKLEPLRSS